MSIGARAHQAIKERAKENGTTFRSECEKIDTSKEAVNYWRRKNVNPSSYFIQQMCLQGYDVIYILTGKENKNA